MTENLPMSPLVADIITASLTQTQQVTTRVIDGLQADNADLRAELAAVRDGVTHLLSGPYMPMPGAIERALYPGKDAIAAYREEDPR